MRCSALGQVALGPGAWWKGREVVLPPEGLSWREAELRQRKAGGRGRGRTGTSYQACTPGRGFQAMQGAR